MPTGRRHDENVGTVLLETGNLLPGSPRNEVAAGWAAIILRKVARYYGRQHQQNHDEAGQP